MAGRITLRDVYWYGASVGATRIGVTTSDGDLRLSAFRNTDGSVTVVALNAAGSATPVSFSLQDIGFTTGTATPYPTNGSHSTARQPAVPVTGGSLKAEVPARSLVTYTTIQRQETRCA